MKILLSVCFSALLSAVATAQNLVPNHSFEVLNTCDLYFEEFNQTQDWKGYQFTPDIFNTCSKISFLSVPNNVFDRQYAADGKGYAGILTYHKEYKNEIIGTKLKTPLQKGEKYLVRFKVSRAETHAKYASDNLGALFTNTPEKTPYCGKAHILSAKIITDSNGWELVSGVFQADDNYQYLVIGNFFDRARTSLQKMDGGAFEAAYYFIDDVSVMRTSADITPIMLPQKVTVTTATQPKADIQPKKKPTEEGVALAGKVLDAETHQPVVALMELSAPNESKKEEYETDYISGQYAFTNIPHPENFTLKITARNYFPSLQYMHITSEKRMKKDFYLYPLKAGQRIELKYVAFQSGTADLIPEAFEELGKLIQVLRDNPLMKIEVQGYTDKAEGIKLARERAQTVIDYLVKFGQINANRLIMNALYQTPPYKEAGNAADEERRKERIEVKILN